MMDFLINEEELALLYGLPHIQQLTYLRGIRPYMDIKTGRVGIKRRVSYQSISEQLDVEPRPGIKSQRFSRDQVRRAVLGLERVGLIQLQSEGLHLIFECPLASLDYSVQNKAAINPPQKAVTKPLDRTLASTGLSEVYTRKATIAKLEKAAIPLKEDNYIYLLSQFENFWSLYPEKKSKQKAQIVFEDLKPDPALYQQIMNALQAQIQQRDSLRLKDQWLPPWKYPANWLAQRCWEDELSMDVLVEDKNEVYAASTRKNDRKRDLFCPPSESEEPEGNNVISFQRYL